MPGTKRVINIGTNPDDGTGDLLRTAFDKINQNFDDVWSYTAVNSNLDITGDSINRHISYIEVIACPWYFLQPYKKPSG